MPDILEEMSSKHLRKKLFTVKDLDVILCILRFLLSGRSMKREDHLICTYSSVMSWSLLEIHLPAWIFLIPGAFLGAVWQACLKGGTHSTTALMALSVFR